MGTAIDELTAGFEEPFRALGRGAERDRDAVVISWPSVPIEIVRAAGLRPVFARGGSAATPAADAVLEPELFPRRLHALVEAALTGRLAHAAAIVLPRTSDADYKGFLYLRELVRRGAVAALPPVLLFDLLHSPSEEVTKYDVARTRDLCDRLASISGRRPTSNDLRLAIRETSAARAAARRLDALRRSGPRLDAVRRSGPRLDAVRRSEPRLGGSDALPLLGAFWQVPPERYAALASEAADAIAERPPLAGPRVLLAGVPVDSAALHEALESQGAIVVAELSPYGAGAGAGGDGLGGAAGDDGHVAADPIAAIAHRYRASSIDARTSAALLERRIESALPDIDAVVVSLPPDDASFGWDYPRLRALLERRSVPHAVLRGDPERPLSEDDRERVDALLRGASAQLEARPEARIEVGRG